MFNISLQDLGEILRAASLGRALSGLIHNLNGPLQNISMEMEMMNMAVMQVDDGRDELLKNFNTRLKRMEEAFEHISALTRTVTMKIDDFEDDRDQLSLNDFLQQELQFLKSNLYFKHQVQTELELRIHPLPLNQLPEGFREAISWLIEEVVLELEREGLRKLSLTTASESSNLRMTISALDGCFSAKFMEAIKFDTFAVQPLELKNDTASLILALALLKKDGVFLTSSLTPSRSDLILSIPRNNPPA